MCLEISNNLLLVLQDAPKRISFFTNSRSSGQAKNDAKTLFFHAPSPFHGNFCNSIGICTASRFKVQLPLLYTARSNAYSEIGPEVRCDLSRLLTRKITKRIHSSKPTSLNRPIPKVLFGKQYASRSALTHILKPFEDSEPAGLKVDTALKPLKQNCLAIIDNYFVDFNILTSWDKSHSRFFYSSSYTMNITKSC